MFNTPLGCTLPHTLNVYKKNMTITRPKKGQGVYHSRSYDVDVSVVLSVSGDEVFTNPGLFQDSWLVFAYSTTEETRKTICMCVRVFMHVRVRVCVCVCVCHSRTHACCGSSLSQPSLTSSIFAFSLAFIFEPINQVSQQHALAR